MDFSKNRGYPKMDGENNGKPYFLMDDLGVPPFQETPISVASLCFSIAWHNEPSIFFGNTHIWVVDHCSTTG